VNEMQRERMNITSKHRIRVVIKAETEIITSITASSIKQAVILVIMYVKTFKTSVSLSVRPTVRDMLSAL
jgi:hypothetical protein